MRKAKPFQNAATPSNHGVPANPKTPTHFRWQLLTRVLLLVLTVFALGTAWMVFGWTGGQWHPSPVPKDVSWPTMIDDPEVISRQVQAELPSQVQHQLQDWNRLISANFAGDEACAECHHSEYEAHRRSGHSHTAVLMSESSLAAELHNRRRYQDDRRDQVFEFALINRQFLVRDEERANVSLAVTWLLGSGTHAQTPIAVDEESQRGVELRWSSFPRDTRVGVTPDHERFDDYSKGTLECFGRPMDDADIRSCLGCHSTTMTPSNLPIVNSMVVANVGCERCHGPRKKHVDLAHRGRADEVKPMLQYKTAEDYMSACATCHRDESSITSDTQPHELARFQPLGIQRSRCYLETPGNLTCSTCHDPHDTVSHDRQRSIDQCKECHQDGSLSTPAHSPNSDCIECHMPLVPWSSGISFHDHWIRISQADSDGNQSTPPISDSSSVEVKGIE